MLHCIGVRYHETRSSIANGRGSTQCSAAADIALLQNENRNVVLRLFGHREFLQSHTTRGDMNYAGNDTLVLSFPLSPTVSLQDDVMPGPPGEYQ